MKAFDDAEANAYDASILLKVPGYELLQQLATATMSAVLPERARVLLIGVGTGSEVLRLLAVRPALRLTAVDASAAMLERARARLAENNATTSVEWVHAHFGCGGEDQVGSSFDGAMSLLVSHFLPSLHQKERFYTAVAEHLRKSAPFFTADIFRGEQQAVKTELCFQHWSSQVGATNAAVAQMVGRMRTALHPLEEDSFASLLQSVGFCTPQRVFQALDYKGHLVRRA